MKEYSLKRAALQKRQRLYVNRDVTPVLVDMIRAEDSNVESCTNNVYENFKTYYEIDGHEAPPCQHGNIEANCKCKRVIIHCGYDEAIFWCNLKSSR